MNNFSLNDLQFGLQGVDRKRKLAEALLLGGGGGRGDLQAINGMLLPASKYSALSDALKLFSGLMFDKKITEEERDLREQYKGAQQKALEDFMFSTTPRVERKPVGAEEIASDQMYEGETMRQPQFINPSAQDIRKAGIDYFSKMGMYDQMPKFVSSAVEQAAQQEQTRGFLDRFGLKWNPPLEAPSADRSANQGSAVSGVAAKGKGKIFPHLTEEQLLLAAGTAPNKQLGEMLEKALASREVKVDGQMIVDKYGTVLGGYRDGKALIPDESVPGGLRAVAIPGYAELEGKAEEAKERGRTSAQFIDVPMGMKGTVKVRGAEYDRMLAEQADKKALDAAIEAHKKGISVVSRVGDSPIYGQEARDRGKRGATGRVDVSPGEIGFSPSKTEQHASEKEIEFFADLDSKIRESSFKARDLGNKAKLLTEINKRPGVAEGSLAPFFSTLKNVGSSLGIKTEGLPEEQLMNSIFSELALRARDPSQGAGLPGQMAVPELEFLRDMSGRLSQSKEGRALIAKTIEIGANNLMEVGKFTRQYKKRNNGRLDDDFLDELEEYFSNKPSPYVGVLEEAGKLLQPQRVYTPRDIR